jgi:hypothetical protein
MAIGAAAVAAFAWNRLPGYWFRGMPLDGKPVTDATWNDPATRVLVPVGHKKCHHHWRQRRVSAIRAAGTVAAGALGWGWIWHRPATLLAGIAAALCAPGRLDGV